MNTDKPSLGVDVHPAERSQFTESQACDQQTLMEFGRLAIAFGRLDADLGALWYQLAPDPVHQLKARRASAGEVRAQVRKLARQQLDSPHREDLLAFVDEVHAVQTDRNGVMHSRRLLEGRDSMRPVAEFLSLSEEERGEYIFRWEREAVVSEDWRRQANGSLDSGDPQRLDELIAIERRLANTRRRAQRWSIQMPRCGS